METTPTTETPAQRFADLTEATYDAAVDAALAAVAATRGMGSFDDTPAYLAVVASGVHPSIASRFVIDAKETLAERRRLIEALGDLVA